MGSALNWAQKPSHSFEAWLVLVHSLFPHCLSPHAMTALEQYFQTKHIASETKKKTIWAVDSLLLQCEAQGLSSSHQTWWQTPLSAEPSHWPYPLDFNGTYTHHLEHLPSSIYEVNNTGPMSPALECSHSPGLSGLCHIEGQENSSTRLHKILPIRVKSEQFLFAFSHG